MENHSPGYLLYNFLPYRANWTSKRVAVDICCTADCESVRKNTFENHLQRSANLYSCSCHAKVASGDF